MPLTELTTNTSCHQASSIDPIDYDEKLPFPYNNFIYKVTLTTQTTPESFNNAGPYTVKPQPGITSFVVRLSNPSADGLNPANRVESEVASLHLARQGLLRQKPEIASVIPAIYAWRSPLKAGDAITQLGWIAMEFKHGVPLDMAFKTLTMSQKENVLGQLADVFGGVQKAPLPASIDRYGGVTIDGTGSLVPGQMTTLKGGPWGSYGSFWDNRISSQVEGADRSSIIGGWRLNGVRDRIDKLLEAGLEAVLSGAGVDLSLKTLIHGDLSKKPILTIRSQVCKVTDLV